MSTQVILPMRGHIKERTSHHIPNQETSAPAQNPVSSPRETSHEGACLTLYHLQDMRAMLGSELRRERWRAASLLPANRTQVDIRNGIPPSLP